MFQVSLTDTTPYEKFKGYLEEGNWIYADEGRLNNAVTNIEVKIRSRYEQLVTALFGVTYLKVHVVNKQHIIDYLIDIGVPEAFFCKYRGDQEPKYYNDKVRYKIMSRGYACDVFWIYEDYQRLKRESSAIRNVIHRQSGNKAGVGNEGQSLVRINYQVLPKKNLRFNTAKENTIGFYGDLQAAFCAPEDFYILSCDFPQIDARAALNLYLKNDHLAELSSQVDDTYLLFKEYARYVNHQHDLKELEEANNLDYYVDNEPLEKRISSYRKELVPFSNKGIRDIYKVTALKTAYYSRHSVIPQENKTMKDLTRMYESTERYKRILAMATLMFNLNIPIEVKSRWGHKRLIIEQDLRATLSSVFNAPIQSTSSEAVIFYVVHFLDYFREKGYGPEDVRICLNRHDEPVMYIRKDIFNQHIYFIASMRTFLVEGWSPITLDIFVGDYYKESLPECADMLERVPSEKDKAMLASRKFKSQEEPYTLVEPLMVSVAHRKLNDGSMRVAFVWQEGSLPEELILQNEYEDRRNFNIKVLSFKTSEQNMNSDLLQQVTNSLSNMIDTEDAFLVMGPYNFNQDVLLTKRTAYFRHADNSMAHNLAKAALSTLVSHLEPNSLTDRDRKFMNYLEKHKGRISQ